jgi:deoxyribonuclease V
LRLDRLIQDQNKIAQHIRIKPCNRSLTKIAGIDAARSGTHLYSCIGVFSFPDLYLLDHACVRARVVMPYIPGFLSYRELPVFVKAFKRVKIKPDLILVDGQGITHPRRTGIASHLGVILNVPTIGCAKSHLFGTYVMPGHQRGQFAPVHHAGEVIGIVLRTRGDVKPLFVSPGHLVDIGDCLDIVLRATTRYRLPEPIRYAHRTAGLKARSMSGT